jgi:hypothetical protein
LLRNPSALAVFDLSPINVAHADLADAGRTPALAAMRCSMGSRCSTSGGCRHACNSAESSRWVCHRPSSPAPAWALRQPQVVPDPGAYTPAFSAASIAFWRAALALAAAGIEQLVVDDSLMSDCIRARASLNANEAVGLSEAPRGTLFHHYRVDDGGLITRVNLIIATGQNNLAMNRRVAQIAREFITEPVAEVSELSEPLLNRLEAGIRCFDPCLSCSTHAAGQMPLRISLLDAGGRLLAERVRD